MADPQRNRQSYTYTFLPGSEIRILELHPAERMEDELVISLTRSPRAFSRGFYDAVSYAWGSDSQMERVVIYDSISDSRTDFNVRKTVTTMLRHLRYQQESRRLWIDSICIDQNNLPEKSVQVTRMGDVYINSSITLVWLGPTVQDSSEGRQFRSLLHRIVEGSPVPSDDLKALRQYREDGQAFMELPWFRRRWIIQEAVLSPRVVMILGVDQVKFVDVMKEIGDFWIGARKLSNSIDQAVQTIYTIQRLCRPSRDEISFLQLLLNLHAAQCVDDRDRLYALNNLNPDPISIDYSQPPEEIYTRFAMGKAQEDLRILYCAGVHRGNRLPSWVPDWRAPRHYMPCAGLNSEEGWGKEFFVSVSHERLMIRGYQLGVVSSKGPSLQSLFPMPFQILRECFKFFLGAETTSNSGSDSKFADQFMSVLTFGSVTSGANLAPWLETDVTIPNVTSPHIDLPKCDHEKKEMSLCPYPYYDTNNHTILSMIELAMHGRSCFLSHTGRWAIGPNDILPGDVIVVFAGCKTPMIMRQVADKVSIAINLKCSS